MSLHPTGLFCRFSESFLFGAPRNQLQGTRSPSHLKAKPEAKQQAGPRHRKQCGHTGMGGFMPNYADSFPLPI